MSQIQRYVVSWMNLADHEVHIGFYNTYSELQALSSALPDIAISAHYPLSAVTAALKDLGLYCAVTLVPEPPNVQPLHHP